MDRLQSDLILKDENPLALACMLVFVFINYFVFMARLLLSLHLTGFFFATVVHKLNSKWTCSELMQATQISCSGSADFPIWGWRSSESRVPLWVCWASFLKRGPGVFIVQPSGARWMQPVLKVTPIRPAWLADWEFWRAVVICMSQKTSVFYKAFIRLICVALPLGANLVVTLTAEFGIVPMYSLWIAFVGNKQHVWS